MVTRTLGVRIAAAIVIGALVALVIVIAQHAAAAAYAYDTYVGTYVLQDGRADDITIHIEHATTDGWEGHATIGCKGCESVARATEGWSITIFSLERSFDQKPIATFVGTLSADGRTLSGPITKDGVKGVAILTAR